MQIQNINQIGVRHSEAMSAAVLGLIVGGILIIGVAFAHPQTIHNAAHDTRHAAAFPCH